MTAATLILVAGGAVACGGDDNGGSGNDGGGGSASSDSGGTSVDDFCGAFEEFSSSLFEADTTDTAAVIKVLKDEAGKLDDVGTPEDIPEDAEEGLDLVLGAIQDLPDDATLDDISALEDDFSEEDKAKADAFDTYLADTCPELGSGGDASSPAAPESGDATPSEVPSESPSESPSE